MPDSSGPDVLIRSRLVLGDSEFVVVDRRSSRPLGGPFAVLAEAVGFAIAQSPSSETILYEALDERGRTTGEPMVLRVSNT